MIFLHIYYSDFTDFRKFSVSHGSVATHFPFTVWWDL